ncbi:MAG: caspase family protein [Gammaproteobacteria bacterium]|nr:caspase family protein [Gammaproteobacteria bacterium]
MVILDACRNNPLPRSFRSSQRGLARFESPKGTIIGIATSPGSVASDGDNGLYTAHFLKNMTRPGLSIESVFKRVLQGVNKLLGQSRLLPAILLLFQISRHAVPHLDKA